MATLSVAPRLPTAAGMKVTENVQLAFAPATSVAPQVFVCAKSLAFAPVIDLVLMVSTEPALPALVNVTSLAALVVLPTN